MEQRTWLITGVSSGLGKAMAGQLLARGDRVIGTVRYRGKVADLLKQYPWTFKAECLDLTNRLQQSQGLLTQRMGAPGEHPRRRCACT